MTKQALLIINPVSGTDSKEGLADTVRRALHPHMDVRVELTRGRGDATQLARMAVEQGLDAVIAAGGDGTVNETARALCGTGMPMGIVPCGSGNGLARHLGIPQDVDRAVAIVAEGHIDRCDYGTAAGHPFFCTFGLGFDAAVSAKFATQKRRGRLTYIRNTFEEYLHYNPRTYTIAANGKVLTEEAFLIAVCNASQYGNNAYIAPHASMTDGLLDVTVVRSGTPLEMPWVGVDLLSGYLDRNTMVDTFRTSELVIMRKDAEEAHLDGEPCVLPTSIGIECHPGALSLYTPVVSEPFKPLVTPARALLRDIGYAFRQIFR